MNRTTTMLLAIFLFAFPVVSLAAQPKVGASTEGGIYLYREKVEMFWNHWIGFPIMTKTAVETQQARLTVVGEGKTAMFVGNLSINCTNGKYFWESAGNGSEFLQSDKLADEIVPRSAINNAIRLLCKRG